LASVAKDHTTHLFTQPFYFFGIGSVPEAFREEQALVGRAGCQEGGRSVVNRATLASRVPGDEAIELAGGDSLR